MVAKAACADVVAVVVAVAICMRIGEIDCRVTGYGLRRVVFMLAHRRSISLRQLSHGFGYAVCADVCQLSAHPTPGPTGPGPIAKLWSLFKVYLSYTGPHLYVGLMTMSPYVST
jgi:hypothetical protein